jgi:hypothetical protein
MQMIENNVLWVMYISYPKNKEAFRQLVTQTGTTNDVLVAGKKQKIFYSKMGIFNRVYDLFEELSNDESSKSLTGDLELPAQLAKQIYKYVEYDRNLNTQNIETIDKVVKHHYRFCEHIVKTNQYHVFYAEVGHLISRLLVEVGLKYNMRIIWPMMSFWEDRLFISSGTEFALQEEVQSNYSKIQLKGISKKESDFAIRYIERFRRDVPKMAHMPEDSITKIRSPKKKLFFHRLYDMYMDYTDKNYNENNYSINYRTIPDLAKRKIQKLKPNYYKYSKPHFSTVSPNDKYILYYLHYEPDLSTLVWGVHYKDQISFIKKLSYSIPFQYRLYVKEHPLMQKKRPKGFYEDLDIIPQVRLIDPETPTNNLLSSCECVVTITGTIGWEALLMKKPVITFGNVFYNCYEFTKHITSFEELADAINLLIVEKEVYDEDSLINFVTAVYESTYAGDWYRFAMLGETDVTNSDSIIKSFQAKCRELRVVD